MSDIECECGGPHYWAGATGEEYCSCCGGQKRLLDEIGRLHAEVERFTDALKAEESRILADERLYYPPAAWQVNAILVAVSLFTVTDWLEERASPRLVLTEEMPHE